MTEINIAMMRKLIDSDKPIQVIEVLGEKDYRSGHVPGAINVPLGEAFDEAIQRAVTEKHTPVIDMACQASTKAAERMDALGYVRVYDYKAGKRGWQDAGFPVE